MENRTWTTSRNLSSILCLSQAERRKILRWLVKSCSPVSIRRKSTTSRYGRVRSNRSVIRVSMWRLCGSSWNYSEFREFFILTLLYITATFIRWYNRVQGNDGFWTSWFDSWWRRFLCSWDSPLLQQLISGSIGRICLLNRHFVSLINLWFIIWTKLLLCNSMTELIWEGKYKDGKKASPVRIALPFQTIETVNESIQQRKRPSIFLSRSPMPNTTNGATGLFGEIKNMCCQACCRSLQAK